MEKSGGKDDGEENKYHKIPMSKKKREEFTKDLEVLRQYTFTVLVLSLCAVTANLGAVFVWKLKEITDYLAQGNLCLICVGSFLGHTSIIKVQMKMSKYPAKTLDRTFSFEALFVYLRSVIILLPLTIYNSLVTLRSVDRYESQLRAI